MIVCSEYAIMKMAQRRIKRDFVIQALRNPDFEKKSYGGRMVRYKRFGKLHLAVVYRTEDGDMVVITQHWVAKTKRQ